MLKTSHFPQFIAPRLGKTVSRLEAMIWSRDDTPLTVQASTPSPTPVDATAAKRLAYRSVNKLPATWGQMFDQRWWKLKLPKQSQSSAPRYLIWDDQAEATIYYQGSPIYGFDPGHLHCPIPKDARELLIESMCCRTGVWVPSNNTPMSVHGSVFGGAFLAQRDDDAWHAFHDLQVLAETLMLIHRPGYPDDANPTAGFGYRPSFDQAPPIFRSTLKQLDDAIDQFDRLGTKALRQALAKIYRSFKLDDRSHTAVLVGHAHIDLVWMWPRRISQGKAVHSFANALSVMERYPEFHFTYSQPASYRDVQATSPKVMERVASKIRAKKWEATGVMEVESDTQIPCGEALVRSFEQGLKGFKKLNGPKRGQDRVVWLPDTFGYSACIPQIMTGFGVPYFFTTKIHWGSATKFPYTSFQWQGHDGSKVVAHLIQDHYNLEAEPGQLKRIAAKHQQADIHHEELVPTGYGDGGGGPNDAMAERTRRINKLGLLGEVAGVPDARWGRIDEFFDKLNEQRDELPTWRGEMYLQFHRGVQTTHGDLKAAYRAAERALQTWEAVRCATGGGPIDDAPWQKLVFTQFHDCLPGTSIHEVCVDTINTLNQVANEAHTAAKKELSSSGGKACVFNPLAVTAYVATDTSVVAIPPLTGAPRSELESVEAQTPEASTTSIKNDRLHARFDKLGQVRSLTIDGKPVALTRPGAQLWTFPDHPTMYDAWDIDRHTLSNGEQLNTPAKARIESKHTLNATVCFTRKVGTHSEVTIRYRIDPVRLVLLIDLQVDWQEPQVLLKMAFPTAYTGRMARYGSPFGSTLRAQTPGPLEHDAMFEVPASRWAAVTNDTETDGLALATESKYGFGCMDGLLHVSLLRSAKITLPVTGPPLRNASGKNKPPTYSDLGQHTIRLAIGRYTADAPIAEQPAALADALFTQPINYTGKPVSAGLNRIDAGPGLVPAWAKPIAKNRWALRLHETLGQAADCNIDTVSGGGLDRLDLNDATETKLRGKNINIKPYQIVSVGVHRK